MKEKMKDRLSIYGGLLSLATLVGTCMAMHHDKRVEEIRYFQPSPARLIEHETTLWSFDDKDKDDVYDRAQGLVMSDINRPTQLVFEGNDAQAAYNALEQRCKDYEHNARRNPRGYYGRCD